MLPRLKAKASTGTLLSTRRRSSSSRLVAEPLRQLVWPFFVINRHDPVSRQQRLPLEYEARYEKSKIEKG